MSCARVCTEAALKEKTFMHTAQILRSALIATAALALSLPAQAEVKVLLAASKIVVIDGGEHKQAADKAKPGDVIEYSAEYKNTDKSTVRDVMANLPIPSGTEYLPQTAAPEQVMASTDGANFAPVPLKKSVRGADGKITQVPVPYSEYRALRWNFGEIAGGASKTVKARVKVKAAQ
jgi:uncharacterized repeat protein (TIGR01451 family)